MATKRTKVLGATALAVAGALTLGMSGDAMAGGRGGGGGATDRLRDGTGSGWQAETRPAYRQDVGTSGAGRREGTAFGQSSQARSGRGVGVDSPVTPELDAALQRAMVDEVAALTTYEVFVDELGDVLPFTNLVRSEARHVAALERVADRLGIELDAVTPPDVALPATLDEACAAAVAIEEADIALYDELLPELQDWPSVVRVLTNLQNASERHLDAATDRCS